jgi:site-specific DNA-methyltransferase (adenine-specific)
VPSSIVFNMDCLEGMSGYPDKHFELAIPDCPYGLNSRLSAGGKTSKLKNTPMAQLYTGENWDVVPSAEYWEELFRVSKNQIIFGANYFLDHLPPTRGIVCWNKMNQMPTLSEWEFVWTSYDRVAKIFSCSSMDVNRFHPTQKPIKLYKYMLQYARIKPGARVLDTHLGSGSSRIACYDAGLDFIGYETHPKYFEQQEERFQTHISQPAMFEAEEVIPMFEESEMLYE